MKSEDLCKNVKDEIKPLAITLADAVFAMQEKIEQEMDDYKAWPLGQLVRLGTGEKVVRANPMVQEYRAMVRDYSASLNSLKAILAEDKAPAAVSSLTEIREKFKVAK